MRTLKLWPGRIARATRPFVNGPFEPVPQVARSRHQTDCHSRFTAPHSNTAFGHTRPDHQIQEELSRTGSGPAAAAVAAHVPSDDELRHEEHMAHLRSRADELFALMDTNGDGVVDRCMGAGGAFRRLSGAGSSFVDCGWRCSGRLPRCPPHDAGLSLRATAWRDLMSAYADTCPHSPCPPFPPPCLPCLPVPPPRREEFIIGMNMLRDELGWDEAELGTMFTAIDCHGHVSRDQFGDILVAEELRDPSADAELLRHVTRRGHDDASFWSWG